MWLTPVIFVDVQPIGTLRTYQRAGCDNEVVTLKCPPGTSISIQVAQYGKSAPSNTPCSQRSSESTSSHLHSTSCLWPAALQTVVEACQKKRQCKFQTSPKTFGGDPCPGLRKYVEVAYKCRPYEFRSKVACENERIQLKCNPHSRVAVYSASYGRTEYESFQCPQPQGVAEETCLVSYATETVMHICHGKRSCELSADVSTFGNPCRPESRMYLKVVYTCVPRKVLREQYEGSVEPDEVEPDANGHDDDDDFDNYDDGNEFIRESAASPPAPSIEGSSKGDNLTSDSTAATSKSPPQAKSKDHETAPLIPNPKPRSRLYPTRYPKLPTVQTTTKDMQADDISDPNCTVTVYTDERNVVIGFVSDWINTYAFILQNKERFYLYLTLSIGGAVLLILLLLVARLLIQKHKARREAKFHATTVTENTLPNGFTDDISEVDADIDLTTPLSSIAVHTPPIGSTAEVVRYPHVHSHTLRKQHDSDAPRSLNSSDNSHYYYG